ncbi:Gfo/Idh/MocA family protein [Mangrovicoccus algicola]|uniref:Gfo/Idh/MocA family oxidoreductase n=1 Tax=Mangrovicoccus algicola TaxID=2771008 RepID=A0A8J7CWC2_9RHOB|nr:Gfo/Idh/MocA family oxidoreductase [Mangrovicoccus algicola]MBE3637587.1 Gfo/Idh/MocA family oxidoreductase [Mangrovicoccus algicola]
MGQDRQDGAPRAVLIGAGMVAATHLRACRAAAGTVALHGIMARRPEAARALAAEEGIARDELHFYATAEEVAADPQVDFAIIVTPPDARAALIAPLAAAGKHVLLEKPVARDLAEAAEVVAICEAAGVTLGLVFQHRMRAASRRAAALVASGGLGALGLAEIRVPWWRGQDYYDEPGRGTHARDGGGVLITQAIHAMDLALSLTGPVTRVQAMTATTRLHRMEAEDFAAAGLGFASGAVGSLYAATAAFPGGEDSIALHFEKASLTLSAGHLAVRWRDGRIEEAGSGTGSGGTADPMGFGHELHQAVIEDFAAAIRDGRPPAATGQAALEVHRLIEATTVSARDGRIWLAEDAA